MIVADVMTKNPVCVNPDMSVNDVKALMTKEGVSKFPVLDQKTITLWASLQKGFVKGRSFFRHNPRYVRNQLLVIKTDG